MQSPCELGPFLTQVIDALYEDEMAKRAAAALVSTSGTEARHAPKNRGTVRHKRNARWAHPDDILIGRSGKSQRGRS